MTDERRAEGAASDDEPVGRVLTRREILAFLGATGMLWLARCSGGPWIGCGGRGAWRGDARRGLAAESSRAAWRGRR